MRLELKSISCKGVKSGVPFQKPSLYAVVSVAGEGERPDQKENHHQRQRVKTPVDRRGGENPEWDHPVQLDIGGRRDQGRVLEFEIKAEAILGNKVVGKVRIPLADFDFTGALRHVSYQVRSPDGKPNGTLNCSYRIDDPEAIAAPPAPTPSPSPVVDHYAPPPPPSVPAAGLYPSAPGADYYTPPPPPSAPASGLYPSLPSPTAPAIDYYSSSAPPSAPAAGFYPPPTAPAPAVSYYPAPEPVVAYPSQAPGFGYYSRPDPAFCCPAPAPAPAPAPGFYPRPDPGCGYAPPSGGYYPPPPPVHSAYPPPPPPGCCEAYPPPPPPGCCDPAPRDRGLYGYF